MVAARAHRVSGGGAKQVRVAFNEPQRRGEHRGSDAG